MTSVNKYQIFCITEENFVSGFGEEAPTTCYHDTAHVVNLDSIQLISTISSTTFTATDSSPPKAQFQVTTIPFTVTRDTTPSISQTTISFPFTLHLWNLNIYQGPCIPGDILDVTVGPDTTIGYTTQTCSTGATTITVNPNVMSYILRNSEISISSDTHTEYPGRITSIDLVNFSFIVETPLVNSYPSGSLIKISNRIVKNLIFDEANDRINIGLKGLNTKIIPANTPILLKYTNNTPSTSIVNFTLYLHVEYYFE